MIDLQKLLDNGWRVAFYKNALGSYTATAKRDYEHCITDHFTPEEAVNALADKILGLGKYAQ